MSSVKGIVVRVCERQVAVKYYKAMLHTSAQHSAQLNNQYLIYTYCIYAFFNSIDVEVMLQVKGRVPQEAPGNKHFKTHPYTFLTFTVTHLEASLLYVMFQAASKVKTWKSGLIDNRFLKMDSNFLSVTISVKKALNCEYLTHNISVNYSCYLSE